jgi:hypothetical protein
MLLLLLLLMRELMMERWSMAMIWSCNGMPM